MSLDERNAAGGHTFFTVVVEAEEPGQSFVQVFWAWANHLGAAIDRVLGACARMGVADAVAGEADVYDFETLPAHAVFDRRSRVYYDPSRYYFEPEPSFVAPRGIIKSGQDGDLDYELIREGFERTRRDDGIYEVEAVVERDKLLPAFKELVGRLPSVRVFWLKFAADWEDRDAEEFWVNEGLDTPELIAEYLKANAKDTLENGHVTLTVYSDAGETNLSIDGHKTIRVLTKSVRMQGRLAKALAGLGFEEGPDLHSLARGYYHWHYRPAKSKSRARLAAALKRNGFEPWNPDAAA